MGINFITYVLPGQVRSWRRPSCPWASSCGQTQPRCGCLEILLHLVPHTSIMHVSEDGKWYYLPATSNLLLPSLQGHALVSSGGVPGFVLHAHTALGEHHVREGKVQVVCPLLRQKVPVVVLTSWVISIVCHRRLFLSVVNSLNSSVVWSLVQPARRPTGGRPQSRDHDLDLDSNACGNLVYKACLMCF